MNARRFKRFLKEKGATFEPGNGGHLEVFLNGRRSILPMGSGEMKKGTIKGIRKQLGIEE